MSYITVFAAGEGVVMSADRQTTTDASIPSLKIPDNIKKFFGSHVEEIDNLLKDRENAIELFSSPLTKTAKKIFTMGGNIGIVQGQAMFTDKKMKICLQDFKEYQSVE